MTTALNQRWGEPWDIGCNIAAGTYTNITLNADGEYIAAIFTMNGEVGTTDTITDVGFRQGVATVGAEVDFFDIGIMDISTGGFPDGTFNVSAAVTPDAGNDGKFIWIAITGTALTAGDSYALVLKGNALCTGTDFMTAASRIAEGNISSRLTHPYTANNTGTPARVAGPPVLACKSATKVYGWPASTAYVANLYGATIENMMGFNIPTQFCSTYKVAGVRWIDMSQATGTATSVMTLYSDPTGTNPTILNQTPQRDADLVSVAGTNSLVFEVYFDGTLDTLNAGTDYAIGFAATTINTRNIFTISVETAADFDGWSYGQGTWFGTRTCASAYPPDASDGAFTYTRTKRPWAELILADITPPAGGSGGNANILTGSVVK